MLELKDLCSRSHSFLTLTQTYRVMSLPHSNYKVKFQSSQRVDFNKPLFSLVLSPLNSPEEDKTSWWLFIVSKHLQQVLLVVSPLPLWESNSLTEASVDALLLYFPDQVSFEDKFTLCVFSVAMAARWWSPMMIRVKMSELLVCTAEVIMIINCIYMHVHTG